MNYSEIKRIAIYPAIGIARVGNSPDQYFFGATIPGQPAKDSGDFRDEQGRIKRQATKFHLYALNANDEVMGELTEVDGVQISWKAAVANKKAGWYDFELALDIPAAEGKYNSKGESTPDGKPIQCDRRNKDFEGSDREFLMIDGGEQEISGKNVNADGGSHEFVGQIGREKTDVYLGELRTDDEGRLVFLGGYGKSDSFDGSELTTFANNEGWHDDVSDGSIDATVTLSDGRTIAADGAWVVTAPPNYAVGVEAITTGYDLLLDLAYSEDSSIAPDRPDFYCDVFPLLKNFVLNQWVNAGFSRDFGWGSAYEFDNEAVLERLRDCSDKNRPFRQGIFEFFRNPDFVKPESDSWPPVYGDGVAFNVNADDPRNWYAVTKLQYANLAKWASGDFIVGEQPIVKSWNDLTPAEQAHGLTEAALGETIGGPFHPGCEFTWPMRNAIMYQDVSAYRIRRRNNGEEDFGETLNSEIAFSQGGPLDGSSPGDITKWMAVPWQTDTSSCLSAYKSFAGEYLPTFWPARVPNDVLTMDSYQALSDPTTSKEDKIKAFSPSDRKKWLRGFVYDDEGGVLPKEKNYGITKFTEEWHDIGVIVQKDLDADPNLFPDKVWVETGRNVKDDSVLLDAAILESTAPIPLKRPDWVDQNPRNHR